MLAHSSPHDELGTTDRKIILALSFPDMSIVVGIQKLQRVQADVDLVGEDRELFGFYFPSLQHVDTLFAVSQTVLFLGLDANPVIHGNRSFFEQQIFHGGAVRRGRSSWRLWTTR